MLVINFRKMSNLYVGGAQT